MVRFSKAWLCSAVYSHPY